MAPERIHGSAARTAVARSRAARRRPRARVSGACIAANSARIGCSRRRWGEASSASSASARVRWSCAQRIAQIGERARRAQRCSDVQHEVDDALVAVLERQLERAPGPTLRAMRQLAEPVEIAGPRARPFRAAASAPRARREPIRPSARIAASTTPGSVALSLAAASGVAVALRCQRLHRALAHQPAAVAERLGERLVTERVAATAPARRPPRRAEGIGVAHQRAPSAAAPACAPGTISASTASPWRCCSSGAVSIKAIRRSAASAGLHGRRRR